YDGVSTSLRIDRFKAAVFAGSIVNPTLYGITHHEEGNNIYGAYGWITRVLPKSSIEPFVLRRVSPNVTVGNSKTKPGRLDEKAYGLRLRGTGIAHLDYRAEAVFERGTDGSNPIRAWATTDGIGYTIAKLDWKPRVFAGYDYASGDKNPNDGTHGAF